ncbi:unnamed protein product [Mycena citricolor]|uniref:Cation/H+ exchanger transmembrane domain-containing protein n=1 Tax=Mycena citricolor TaxID=2018698 RepID=A0AAD2GTJ8_9AGAR|nr:unnamed protein product [Mycena citricolor]
MRDTRTWTTRRQLFQAFWKVSTASEVQNSYNRHSYVIWPCSGPPIVKHPELVQHILWGMIDMPTTPTPRDHVARQRGLLMTWHSDTLEHPFFLPLLLPAQMPSTVALAYVCLGGFVVALCINEVVVATLFGILVGPYCANIFNPHDWGAESNKITLEVLRVVLAAGLFAIGVELPKSYMAQHAKGLLILVVPTMAVGWFVVAGLIHVLFPKLEFVSCLVIAACLTPTDPIICASIVGGKYAARHVPLKLRQVISAESAANDGLAYPFLSISLYLTLEASRAEAFKKWVLVGWLYQVILGSVIGAALGAVNAIGSDDLLAAFAAGSAISWDGRFNDVTEDEIFWPVIDLVLNCACFVYIGAWIPFGSFDGPALGITPWRLRALLIAVIIVRRIPAVLMLYHWVPEIEGWREALFAGHFGPMGVGAVFVSTMALTRLAPPQNGDDPETQVAILAMCLQPIVAFLVLGSIFIHGLSIPLSCFLRSIVKPPLGMNTSPASTVVAPVIELELDRTNFGRDKVHSTVLGAHPTGEDADPRAGPDAAQPHDCDP